VHLHGGTIEAFSEGEGKGCTFVYKIPMKKCPQTADDDALHEFAMDEKMNEDEIRPAMLPSTAAAMVSDLPRLPIIPLSPRDGIRSNESRKMAAHHLSIVRPQLLSQSQQGEGRRPSSLLANTSIPQVTSSGIVLNDEKSRESSAGDLPLTVCLLSYTVPLYVPSSPPL